MEAATRGLIYVFHALFFGAFLLRLAPKARAGAGAAATEPQAARSARALVALHGVAFAAMYYGVGQALAAPDRLRLLWTARPVVGGAIILTGAAVIAWTMRVFRSWRFQARIDSGHQLSTEGPFRWVRHPIYAALDLLALGTLLWIPTVGTAAGLLLMMVIGDMRARGEEKVLLAAFGDAYRRYQTGVRRFVPGIY
jgi:protein-S-isoprenylcysteine O-methyltransferase Ste14